MTGNKNRGATVSEPHFCIHIYMKDTENDLTHATSADAWSLRCFSVHLQDASVVSGYGSSVSLVRRWRQVQQTSIEKKVFTVVLVMQICHKTKTGKWKLPVRSENPVGLQPPEPGFPHPCSGRSASSRSKGIPQWPQRDQRIQQVKDLEGLDKYWKSSVSSFFSVSGCKVLWFSPGELVLVFLLPFLVLRRKQKWA